MSSFLVDHQEIPVVFLLSLIHCVKEMYAFWSRVSNFRPGKHWSLAKRHMPLAARSRPHPRWNTWHESGNMSCCPMPGTCSKWMPSGSSQKGLWVLFGPIVPLQLACIDMSSQLVASQRWHFSLQLKPQLRWYAWAWTSDLEKFHRWICQSIPPTQQS